MTSRGAPLDPASPLPLWIGILLALGAVLAALAVLATFGLSTFPAIVQACGLNLLGGGACTADAARIGVYAVLAYLTVLACGIALYRRSDRRGDTISIALPATAIRVVLIATFAVVLVHLGVLVAGPAFASRSDENLHYGALVSIENLLWPLLLQLYVSQPDARLRAAVLAALLAVMALSPYRSASLAIMTFGFAVPLAATLWQTARAGWPRGLVLAWLRQAALAVVIGAVVAWGGYVGTVTRFPSLLVLDLSEAAEIRARNRPPVTIPAKQPETPPPAPAAAVESPQPPPAPPPTVLPTGTVTAPPPAGIGARMAQRIVFPLYQAAIVGKLATLVPLPSLSNEFGRKFRLTEEPTLEEFLFRRIYGGTGTDQTTSLFYGEAVAYFPGPPLAWMILGPLTLVFAALLLRRAGIASATTLGVALWRSSFSGLTPVLPALLIQLASLAAMAWSGRFAPRALRLRQLAQTTARHGLTLATAVVLAVQVWTVAATPDRRALAIARFTVAPQCRLVAPTWVSIRTDQALAASGLSIRSSLAFAIGDALAVSLPHGSRMEPLLPEIARRIGTLVECAKPEPAEKVTVSGTRRFPGLINPLDVLAALALAVALLAMVGRTPAPQRNSAP